MLQPADFGGNTYAVLLWQVWNMNPVNGVVGVFNVQGSSWSRKKRAFHTHDPTPPLLQTLVTPADIPAFAQSSSTPQHFVMHSDQNRKLILTAHQKELPVTLKAGTSDVITVAPVFGAPSRCQVACIGFVNMLNPGGSVLDVKMHQPSSTRMFATCDMLVKGYGELVLYVSKSPLNALVDGQRVANSFSANEQRMTIRLPQAANLQRLVQVEL